MAVIAFDVDPEALADARAGGGGGVLPEGWYVLRVKDKNWDPPKPNGWPRLVLKCEVLQSFNGQLIGKTITRRLSLSPKAVAYFLLPFLNAAGVPVHQGQGGKPQFDDDAVLGATTKVDCTHQKGDTRTFEDWNNDQPVGPANALMPAQAPLGGNGTPPWMQQQPGQAPAQMPMQGAPAPQWQPPAQQQQQAQVALQTPWGQLPPRGQG